MGLGINDEEDKTMKKIKTTIQTLAALLMAVAATTACSNDDNIADEPTPATTDAPKTYTMTVTASKGDDASTRALTIEGKTLNATWTAGDVIKVLKKDKRSNPAIFRDLGTLSATTVSADGLTATFTGSFADSNVTAAGGLAEGDKLVLAFPGTKLNNTTGLIFNYNGQNGTLATLANDYDYCMTSTTESKMVTVSEVSATGEVSTTGTASFDNLQAIVCFTLTDKNGNPLYPTSLDITANGLEKTYKPLDDDGMAPGGAQTLTLTPSGSTNVIYAAVRGFSGKDVTLTAKTSSGRILHYTKSNVTFTNGNYYAINVKMSSTNLAALTANYEAKDGDVLTGTLPSGIHLTIDGEASVTLKDVTINDNSAAGIRCIGNATITLSGTNTVTSTDGGSAGIQVDDGLTIQGDGSLNVTGAQYAAGIGSEYYGECGNIIINGGNVTATGGEEAAGIGSGCKGSCGNITISGGTLTATGGKKAAAIGSGSQGKCGTITISGDVTRIKATKGTDAPCSIGKGKDGVATSTCGTITIGGTVYAEGVTESPFLWHWPTE